MDIDAINRNVKTLMDWKASCDGRSPAVGSSSAPSITASSDGARAPLDVSALLADGADVVQIVQQMLNEAHRAALYLEEKSKTFRDLEKELKEDLDYVVEHKRIDGEAAAAALAAQEEADRVTAEKAEADRIAAEQHEIDIAGDEKGEVIKDPDVKLS